MSLVELLDVIGENPSAPAALSLLFAEEEEGKRNGLDWSRSRELFAGSAEEGEDEEGHVHEHLHGHDHDHDHDHDHVHAHEHFGLRGAHDWEDEPYGFDRFDDECREDFGDED